MVWIQASKAMDQLRGYNKNCGFSIEPRFGSIKVKIPNIQSFVAEKGKDREQDQAEEEEEAKSIGLGEEEEEDDVDGARSMDPAEGDVDEEEKKHICRECGKRFKSGKALGGHKRIHALENRKFSKERQKIVPGVVGGSDERGEVEVDCCVCHKKFTSMKALYGHMRFHPDRGWKGVLPPPHPQHHPHPHPHPLGNSSSSTLSIDDHDGEFISSDDDDDEYDYDHSDDYEKSELWDNHRELQKVIDLKESIRWSWRGKRGRRSVLKVDESDLKDPPPEDVKDIEAKDLLFLATTAEAVNLDDFEETSDSHSLEEKTKKRKTKKKRLSEMEKESSSTHDHHQAEAVVVAAAAAAAEEGDGAREKHVCVTCNKSFTSYQALGGHRASHNKVKILENHQARANGEASLLGTEATIAGLASAQGSNTSLSSSNNNGDHICNICHKSFPTGQALGGHKRCHWTGPVASSEAATAPTAASNSSQVTGTLQEVKRTFLEFDLNELPPNEE